MKNRLHTYWWSIVTCAIAVFFLSDFLYATQGLAYERTATKNIKKNELHELPPIHTTHVDKTHIYSTLPHDRAGQCHSMLAETLATVPQDVFPPKLNIELHIDVPYRGFANSTTIFMNCDLPVHTFNEVFWHELGHIHYHSLKKDLFASGVKNPFAHGASGTYPHTQDYITQYATTNEHEDFADSFMMYTLYHDTFKTHSSRSDALNNKYEFIATHFQPLSQLHHR